MAEKKNRAKFFKRRKYLQCSIQLLRSSKSLSFLYGVNSSWDTREVSNHDRDAKENVHKRLIYFKPTNVVIL